MSVSATQISGSPTRPEGAPASDGRAVSARAEWVECRDCGLFQPLATPLPGHRSACQRCRATFGHSGSGGRAALPLMVTGLVLFTVMQAFPVIGIELSGLSQRVRIASAPLAMIDHGLLPVAALVVTTAVLAPLFRIVATAYVLLHLLWSPRRPRSLATLFRLSEGLRSWAMLDVLLLGLLIAFAKLHDLAATDVGIGFWALALLVILLALIDARLDRRVLWAALADRAEPPPIGGSLPGISCRTCGLVDRTSGPSPPGDRCRRCHARLTRRKPDSLGRTWALVLTGAVLYIPANLYPALTVISFGQGMPSTILGGVIELMNGDDWPLALLIFMASVAVPLLKLLGPAALLLSSQWRLRSRLLDRTRLYRIIMFVGRWSMIDVFVAATLTALVTLGRVATVEPGLGIVAFGGVVVVTMLAAESFDPRLMWDAAEVAHG